LSLRELKSDCKIIKTLAIFHVIRESFEGKVQKGCQIELENQTVRKVKQLRAIKCSMTTV
jgi:hypothetical protein